MTAFYERDNPLTDDQIADIGEGRYIISAKEALEMDHAFHQYQKDIAKHNLVRYYRTDTLLSSCSDSIIDILNFQPSLSEEYIKAFEYLIMNDSLDYQEVIILPEPGLKSGKVRHWPVHTLINENYLKIYPNPAKNVVIIETRLKEEPRDAFINIIDSKGIKIKSYPIQKRNEYQVIPLSDLQSGILLCQLIVRHKIAETRKLIIVK